MILTSNSFSPDFLQQYPTIDTRYTMVSFRSSLIVGLLASSSAFAVKPAHTSLAFTQRSSSTRVPVNLSMSGGASAVPDLKVS